MEMQIMDIWQITMIVMVAIMDVAEVSVMMITMIIMDEAMQMDIMVEVEAVILRRMLDMEEVAVAMEGEEVNFN